MSITQRNTLIDGSTMTASGLNENFSGFVTDLTSGTSTVSVNSILASHVSANTLCAANYSVTDTIYGQRAFLLYGNHETIYPGTTATVFVTCGGYSISTKFVRFAVPRSGYIERVWGYFYGGPQTASGTLEIRFDQNETNFTSSTLKTVDTSTSVSFTTAFPVGSKSFATGDRLGMSFYVTGDLAVNIQGIITVAYTS